MTGNVDWNTIANQKTGSKKNGDVVFLNSKNLPQSFLPSQQIVVYEAVYDEATKRNRPSQSTDENVKVRTQYLFYGLFMPEDAKRYVKICSCGQMIAKGISAVQRTLSNLGLMDFVKVTSTGTGMNTEYFVEAEPKLDPQGNPRKIPLDIWDKLTKDVGELPTLEEMRDRLLGIVVEEEIPEAVASATSVNNKSDKLFI